MTILSGLVKQRKTTVLLYSTYKSFERKRDIQQQSATDRYIHFTSSQAWKEKASAIRTLKARALEYSSDQALLAEELNHLLMVFIKNGYPENTVRRILYQASREKKNYAYEIEFDKALYVSKSKKILQNNKRTIWHRLHFQENTNPWGNSFKERETNTKQAQEKHIIQHLLC